MEDSGAAGQRRTRFGTGFEFFRVLLGAVLLLAVGCGGPGSLLALADARSESDADSAVAKAADVVAARGRQGNDRVAAALALGRLRRATPDAVAALQVGLGPDGPPDLRAAAAWALGELRDRKSLAALLRGLDTPVSSNLGRQILQGVAKHQSLLETEPELVVAAVEAMSRYLGRVPTNEVPPIFDLLGQRLRTLEVDIEVLSRAIRAHDRDPSPANQAGLYSAAFELLARLDVLRTELGARGANPRAEEAIRAAAGAVRRADGKTRDLVLWFLGQLANAEVYARASGLALAKWSRDKGSAGRRLVRAWGLARARSRAPDAQRVLARDILRTETDPAVLEAWASAVSEQAAEDALQRVLGVEARR